LPDPVPVRIGGIGRDGVTARALGREVAAVVRYRMAVLDREDRLESGSGTWLASFRGDAAIRAATLREVTLRTLRIGFEERAFRLLEALDDATGRSMADLAAEVGLPRLAAAEVVADLVSAGLAVRVPEADQVRGTAAGGALVALVRLAAEVAGRELEEGP